MIKILKEDIERHRQSWKKVAEANNWSSDPFYIAIWVDQEGKICNSLCTTQILSNCTKDIIKSEIDDSELLPDQYEII